MPVSILNFCIQKNHACILRNGRFTVNSMAIKSAAPPVQLKIRRGIFCLHPTRTDRAGRACAAQRGWFFAAEKNTACSNFFNPAKTDCPADRNADTGRTFFAQTDADFLCTVCESAPAVMWGARREYTGQISVFPSFRYGR